MLTDSHFIRHCRAELKYPSLGISCARETAKSVSYILSIAFIVSFTLLSPVYRDSVLLKQKRYEYAVHNEEHPRATTLSELLETLVTN
jgi:hypothetical protein